MAKKVSREKLTKASWEGFRSKEKSETDVEDMTIGEIGAIVRGSKAVIYEVSNHMLYRQDADDIRTIGERLHACGLRLEVLSRTYEGLKRNAQRPGATRLSHITDKGKK